MIKRPKKVIDEDSYTDALPGLLAPYLEPATAEHVEVWPVFNGTGANVVSLMAMTSRWGAVVCSDVAHINTDEGGAPERVGGLKLYGVPTTDGKLTPDLVDQAVLPQGHLLDPQQAPTLSE